MSGVAGTLTPIDRVLAEDATYTWRVRATDRPGLTSEWSPDQTFKVRECGDGCCGTEPGCQVSGGIGPGAGLAVGAALDLLALARQRRGDHAASRAATSRAQPWASVKPPPPWP